MQETRHTATAVRYLYGTPQGILEFRAIPTKTGHIKTLILHTPGCDAEQCNTDLCDCESADDLALSWLVGDDQGVWSCPCTPPNAPRLNAPVPRTSPLPWTAP